MGITEPDPATEDGEEVVEMSDAVMADGKVAKANDSTGLEEEAELEQITELEETAELADVGEEADSTLGLAQSTWRRCFVYCHCY